MLRRNGGAFIEQNHARAIHPGSQDRVERKAPPAQIIVQILLLDRMRPLIGNLPGFAAHIEFCNVALFRDLHPLLVRKFSEAPEQRAFPVWPPVMETVSPSLHLAVANGEICLSA